MLFLARFRDVDGTSLAPVLVDAETSDAAIARVESETGELPGELLELPPGLLLCEMRLVPDPAVSADANPEGDEDVIPVLEPFADFADWLFDADLNEVTGDGE